jgi:hypothetical protein
VKQQSATNDLRDDLGYAKLLDRKARALFSFIIVSIIVLSIAAGLHVLGLDYSSDCFFR